MPDDSEINTNLLKLINRARHTIDTLAKSGADSMIVGGAVRNIIAQHNIPSKDIDITTTMNPSDAMDCLQNNGFKVIDTGSKFGSFTAIDPDGSFFEVTSLRKDIKCDGRHAIVAFGGTFAEDSLRRDFTINAIYLDKNGRIYDFHNGIDDLKKGVVRFIGNPKERIKEDFLRILRFFRFSAKFAKSLDREALLAISHLSNGLQHISNERIHDEFLKIIYTGKTNIVRAMHDTGIINALFGSNFDINYAELEYISNILDRGYILNCKTNALIFLYFALCSECEPDAIRSIALSREENNLLDMLDILRSLHNALKITNELRKILVSNKRHYAKYILSCNRALSVDVVLDLLDRSQKMPISGNDIMNEFGIVSGKIIGMMLDTAKQMWVESDFNASKEDIMTYLAPKISCFISQ